MLIWENRTEEAVGVELYQASVHSLCYTIRAVVCKSCNIKNYELDISIDGFSAYVIGRYSMLEEAKKKAEKHFSGFSEGLVFKTLIVAAILST